MPEGVIMQEKPRALRNIAVTFAVITVLLLGIVAYSTLGKATVTIALGDVSKEVSFRIPLGQSQAGQGGGPNVIPATFFETTDSATDTFSPTGGGSAPTGKAGGSVTFHNNTANDQPLVATTRLLTPDGILFRLKSAVRIPARGTATGLVLADKDGVEGEVAPTTFTIPGLSPSLQKSIYADSTAAMVRGAAEEKIVKSEDIDAARKTLTDRLREKAQNALVAQAGANSLSASDFVSDVLEETVSAKPGDKTASFTMTIKVNSVGVSFNKEELMKRIADDAGGGAIASESVQYTLVNYDPILKTVTATGKVSVNRAVEKTSSIFSAVNFVNMTPDQVRSFLGNYDGISAVRVDLSPTWQSTLPSVPNRIEVKFQ